MLGGLNGRRIELRDYMKNSKRPEGVKKELLRQFAELQFQTINPAFLELIQAPKADRDLPAKEEKTPSPAPSEWRTLFDFVNETKTKQLLAEAEQLYENLGVLSQVQLIAGEYSIRAEPQLLDRQT